MSIVSKHILSIPSHYLRAPIIVVSIAALLGSLPCARAAVPAIDPPPPITAPAATIADGFGVALDIAGLASASAKVGWLFSLADTNVLVSLLTALERNDQDLGSAAPKPQLALASNEMVAIPLAQMLAASGPRGQAILDLAAAPTAPSQLAAIEIYSRTPELANRVLQTQSAAAAFDASLRYLCADKIYADLYPNGTGWNNHAYSDCRPQGALDQDRPSVATNLFAHAAPPPGDSGGGTVIIPCGGSIANVSLVTIGSPAPTQAIASAAPAIASLSSFTSLLGRGQRQ